jgi:hypothetical protein
MRAFGWVSSYFFCFGKLMELQRLAHERFLQLHGQPGARLCHDQSIHGDTSAEQSLLFRCLNLVMFDVPMTHVAMLRSISVDRLVNLSAWSGALSKLAAQWKDATLYVRVTVASLMPFNDFFDFLNLFISLPYC